jgi:hypothetical protein
MDMKSHPTIEINGYSLRHLEMVATNGLTQLTALSLKQAMLRSIQGTP